VELIAVRFFVELSAMKSGRMRTRPFKRRIAKGPAPNIHGMKLRSQKQKVKGSGDRIPRSDTEKPGRRRRTTRRRHKRIDSGDNIAPDGIEEEAASVIIDDEAAPDIISELESMFIDSDGDEVAPDIISESESMFIDSDGDEVVDM